MDGSIHRQEPVRIRSSWLITGSRRVAAIVVRFLIRAQKRLLLFSRPRQSQCLADALCTLGSFVHIWSRGRCQPDVAAIAISIITFRDFEMERRPCRRFRNRSRLLQVGWPRWGGFAGHLGGACYVVAMCGSDIAPVGSMEQIFDPLPSVPGKQWTPVMMMLEERGANVG